MVAEQHALQAHYESLTAPNKGKPRLHLVPKEKDDPLKDPQRRFFYNTISLLTRPTGLRLLLQLPPDGQEIPRSNLASMIYTKTKPANPSADINKLISNGLSEYIIEGTHGSIRNKTHKLTPKGITLRKAIQKAQDFLNEESISPIFFGEDKGHDISSASIRAEILFSIALSQGKGLRQTNLMSLLQRSSSNIYTGIQALAEAKIVDIDENYTARLTLLGKKILQKLLLPIAEITGYPQERIAQLKEALGIKPPPKERIFSAKDIQTIDLIGKIKSEELPAYKKDIAWEELIALYRPLLNTLITIHHLKFHSFSKWEELESHALEGLWRAVAEYDPEKGPLTPFARSFITYEMHDYTDPFVRRTRRPMKECSLEQMAEEHFGRDEGDVLNVGDLPFMADESLNPDKLPHGIDWIINVLRELGIPKDDITLLVKKYVEEMNFQDMHKSNVGIGDRAARRHVHELIDQLKANPEARRRLWCKEG